ncbi:Pycsar system effector family protein [Rhizobium leguminosarum]|uniref:Pycsar system effector family protein n=1 Tax=Rhizobium leguminosarum TaxID=384 RepID=UPI0003FEA50C|nr:Pycsar system effector family protein [Rhizobium leguminosarum]
MAKNDQQEAYEKLMSANHGRMMDFVKFAETKNAALLTFSSVWIGAIINLLKSPDDLPFGYTYAFEAALPLLAIAAIICLKSLLPRFLNQVYKREDDVVNLLYFGDIIKGGVKDYPDMAQKEYLPLEGESATPTYLHDLGVQTAIQASIAHRKFKMFHWAGSLVLLAFVSMALPPIVACGRWVIARLVC